MDIKIQKMLYKLANKSFLKNNVPISAVIINSKNKIIAKGRNNRSKKNNLFGHAEIIALKRAYWKLQGWRLKECTIITTFEPCMMCLGAITQSKIKNIIFMHDEPKFGFINSNHTFDLSKMNIKKISPSCDKEYNHRELIRKFFINLRTKNKNYVKIEKERVIV